MAEITEYILTFEFLFAALGTIIGLLAAKTGIELLSDVQEIFEAVSEAVKKDSESGRGLSPTERDDIKEHVFDLAYKVYGKYKGGILPTVAKGLSKLKFWGKK